MADQGCRPQLGPTKAESARVLVSQRSKQREMRRCHDLPGKLEVSHAADEGQPRRADRPAEGNPRRWQVSPHEPRTREDAKAPSYTGLSGSDEQLQRLQGEEEPRLGAEGDGPPSGHRHRHSPQHPQKRGQLHGRMIAEEGWWNRWPGGPTMRAMLDKVCEAIRRYALLGPGTRVLVAVSGGADSMALLHALHRVREELGVSLVAAHLDHGIRPDTAEDLALVREAAAERGLPLVRDRVDVPALAQRGKLNLEEAARLARREFLERAARQVGATKIALGHTRSDVAETVLLHLLRGAGPRGLRGILPITLPYVRPLILISRGEARAYCQAERIPFRDDPTNEDRRLARNAIRLEVLPILARFNPQAEEALARAARLCGDAEEALIWTADLALAEVSRAEGLDLDLLIVLPLSVQALVVRRAAEAAGVTLEERHVAEVLDALAAGWGEVHLPDGAAARIGSGLVSFGQTTGLLIAERAWALPLNGERKIEELGWAFRLSTVPRPENLVPHGPLVAYFDPRRMLLPLVVRSPRERDRLRPLGMEGTKRARDLLMEARIPRWERARWPLLCDERGIVWVVGVRVSEDHRVMPDASEVLTVEARRL